MINEKGDPVLADIGLTQLMADITGEPFTQVRDVMDSYRWFAPELCTSEGALSCESDIYAFAMTVLEVCAFPLN